MARTIRPLMSLLCLGISHQTAPLEIRERLAFAPEAVAAALSDLMQSVGAAEAVLVSTCNRTELFCATAQAAADDAVVAAEEAKLVDWLIARSGGSDPGIRARLYRHRDDAAVRHLLRVAAGLDSMVLGEPQILGQLKDGYERAAGAGAVGPQLNRLFQRCFAVAKQVRSDTAIGANPVSVASAAVGLARQVFGALDARTAILIGAGETIELVARHLRAQGLARLVVANRNLDRAHDLAARHGGYAIGLDELEAHLHEADLVISATAAPTPVLHEPVVRAARARRRRRSPLLIVDLAVPRDVEAEVAALEDVFLYTVDDLKGVIEDNLRSRRAAAEDAGQIIDAEVAVYAADLKALDAVPSIRALRERAEAEKRRVLAEAQHMLDSGRPPAAVLEWLAHTLANRLLHAPSTNLKALVQSDPRAIELMRALFGLEGPGK
jgi:glutamyl-tRNA reductase